MRKISLKRAIKKIRDSFRDRNDHHSNCNIRLKNGGKCDCYAWATEGLHVALDTLEKALKEKGK